MPPLDTQTQEPDVEQAAQQQDLQDQYERQQAGITPGVTPAAFQRTAPGVYTPVPDTVPAPATGLPTTGITPKPAQSRRAPSISDLEKLPTTAVYGFDQQEAPPKDSFTSDLGHYLGGTLQNWGGSALGFGKFLNDATIDSPGLRNKLDSWTAGFAKGGENQFAKMSPSAQNAARADILRTFNIGPDTDEQGNHIPSPFEAGIGTYLAQRLAPIIAPAAALYFLPEGAVAVTAEIATALLFGSMTAGEGYNKVSDLVNKLPDAELRKQSEPYDAFRTGGASIDEAKGKLKVGTWSSVLATFAAGTAAGFGFGKVLQPGASTGFLASRAIGAGEGAATFGLQSAASNAGGQLGMMQTGIQKGFDTEALARETAAGAVGGLAFGIAAARRAPKPEAPPHPDVDPAAQSALAAAGISNEPPDGGGGGGASTAPPPSGAPPPPSTAPDMSGVPGFSPPPVPQRVFPTESLTRPYAPPESEATGIPGYSPPGPNEPPPPPGAPPGGGGVPPAAQAAVNTSRAKGARASPRAPRGDVPPGVPVEVAPTGEARVVGAPPPDVPGTSPPLTSVPSTLPPRAEWPSGKDMRDGLRQAGVNPKDMPTGINNLAAAYYRQFPEEAKPTTVTEGPPTAPAREAASGPGAAEQAAPQVPGALTPPAPEGVRGPVKAPVAGKEQPGEIAGAFGKMGGAISASLRDMLWAKHEAGDTTEAGAPSNILRASNYLKGKGAITDRASFDRFVNDFGKAQNVGALKTQAGFRKFLDDWERDNAPAKPALNRGSGSPPKEGIVVAFYDMYGGLHIGRPGESTSELLLRIQSERPDIAKAVNERTAKTPEVGYVGPDGKFLNEGAYRELTAKNSTGVRPEGGASPGSDEHLAGATAKPGGITEAERRELVASPWGWLHHQGLGEELLRRNLDRVAVTQMSWADRVRQLNEIDPSGKIPPEPKEVTPGVTEQQQPVSKRAAQKAKMAGGVQVEQVKGHVETPTEGERETAASRQQRLATADQTREQARSTAVGRVRDLLEEATRNVIPLKKGSMEVTPAIQGALRDLVESVGKTDGTMEMVTKAVADWARAHPGRISGTQTSWLAIGDHIHKGMHPEGKGLPEREAFAKGAAAQVEAQPRAVESETQKRQAEVEEAATTKEQDVAREEGVPAGETSAGMTADTATSEKKIAKGTSADVRGRQWIEKAIDPNDETTALQADAAFGGQNQGKGKKRAAGNKDLATIAQRMIDETNAKLDGIVAKITEAQADAKLTKKAKEIRTKKLMDDLNKIDPDRVARLEQVVRELTDEVGVATDARENLLNRIAEKKGEGSVEKAMASPKPDGIDPRSVRSVQVASDPRFGANLRRQIEVTWNHGLPLSGKELARLIRSDPTVLHEAPYLAHLATQLERLAPHVEVLSAEEAHSRGLIDDARLAAYDRGEYSGQSRAYLHTPERDFIILHLDNAQSKHGLVVPALHELSHSITSRLLDNLERTDPNHPYIQMLEGLKREVELHLWNDQLSGVTFSKHELDGIRYALTDIHELHTAALTDPAMYAYLASRQATPRFASQMRAAGFDPKTPGRSLWRYFVNSMQKMLGLRPATSPAEYTLLDHVLRPLQEIAERGSKYNENLLPKDPILRAQAEPLYRDLAMAFGDRARTAIDRVDPKGLSAKATRALLQSAPLDRIVDRFGHLSQHLAGVRNAMDKAQATGAKFLREYADKATMLANQLRGKDDVANLMNDAGYARAVLGSKDPEANAHLTTPEEHAELARLQTEFSKLPTADQELYRRTVDFNNEKYARVRAAAGNRLLNDWLPHGTDAERDVLRKAMRSRKGMEEYLKNPDNPAIDVSKRAIAKGIVSLHLDGYVKGDYFPMRRHGDYIVEYGEHGTPSYGVQAFEKRSEADAFRRDALTRGMDPQEVRERDSIIRNHAMRTSPVVQEMLDRINVTPELKGHADQLRDMVTKLQLQYASTGERARARRRYVAGASKDIGRALQSDTMMQGMQIGNHEHSAELTAAMEGMRQDAGTLARNGGDAFTLDQIRHELQRQIGAGDTAMYSGASGLMRKATSFGYGYSLASPSRVAVETAELLMKMQVFIGAEHGHGRALMEISRALKDISPRLWAKGMGNTAKAIIGKPLSAVDYQLSRMARERLLEVGRDRAGINALFDHMESIGLFDQTKAQSMKELARSTNIGKAFNWFLEVSSAMSHASEESNRIAGTVAAFRAARSKGVSIPDAIKSAENALRKAPNFAPHNKPRIATERGPLGRFGAPIMQFKMFGFNEYWTMANLARDILARNTDPVKRKEAIYGLTGVLMQHALMAGVLTWYADPARYIGGAWDILTGQTPHDHTLAMRKWLSDSIGPTWGEILGRGAPHAVGWDLRTRSGAENLLNVPTMNGFTPKDWALFMGEAAMGASGSDAANVVSGISHMIHGDYLQGIKEILPRLLRDPVKAYDLYDRGLIDGRGKPMLSRDKISGWNIASQALGFVPANVADAREGRQAIQEKEQGENDRKTRLTQKYVSAAPADRPAIWAQIQQFNADPANRSIRINRDQLLQQINQRRKITTQPGAFGLQLPKNRAKELMKAGSFASNVL